MELLPQIEHRRVDSGFDFVKLWRLVEERKVCRDGTVQLQSYRFEVPPTVTRSRVELRYLEKNLPDDVEVWVDGRKLGLARLVDVHENAHRRRWNPKQPETASSPAIDPLDRARKTWQIPEEK